MQTQVERWTLAAAILGSGMAFIDGAALSIVQLTLQSDFAANYNLIAWVVNGYNLMLAALILVGGSLGDIYGRKRIFSFGIILFAGASLACGAAPTIELLIAARIIQGIGGALMVPGSLSLISSVFPPDRRGTAIGLWSMFGALMVILGPLLGGQFAALNFWRGVFFINLPIAAIALYGLRHIPETRDLNARRLDLPGAALITLALAGITYGFTEAPAQGFGSPLVLITLIGGIAALIAFIIVESRTAQPMVPLGLFRSRMFVGTNLLTFFLYSGMGVLPVFFSLNLLRAQAYSPQMAALALLPLALAIVALSRIMGGLVARVGARPLLTIGPAIAGLGFFLFSLPGITEGEGAYLTTYFPAVLIFGIGMGITVAPLSTSVMNSAPSASSGTASGINNAVSRTAGVLAVAIFSALAVGVFGSALVTAAAPLNLEPATLDALRAEAPRLADAAVPESVPVVLQGAADLAIRGAFVEVFRVVAWGAALMAWLGALAALLFVRDRRSVVSGG
jgi:EmrB/QacA subfamily drug resistance transporter